MSYETFRDTPTTQTTAPLARFCIRPDCRIWFPDDGPACPHHKDATCALNGPTDTGKGTAR